MNKKEIKGWEIGTYIVLIIELLLFVDSVVTGNLHNATLGASTIVILCILLT